MFSTPLKNISQNGNLPQVGMKIKNISNHHLGIDLIFERLMLERCVIKLSFRKTSLKEILDDFGEMFDA